MSDDEEKTRDAIDAAVDSVPTIVAAVAPTLAEAVGHVPLVGHLGKALVGIAVSPAAADRAMSVADDALAHELAHEVPTLQRDIERVKRELRLLATRVTAEQRVEPLFDEIARLVVAGTIGHDEIHASPELADRLFRAYRDMVEALDPRVAPALARLVAAYNDKHLTRMGRSFGEFLRSVEPTEWQGVQDFALQVGLATQHAHFQHAVRVHRMKGDDGVLCLHIQVGAEGTYETCATLGEGSGTLLVLAIETGIAEPDMRQWYGSASPTGFLREDTARFFAYIVLGPGEHG